jgi:hypothetical protein
MSTSTTFGDGLLLWSRTLRSASRIGRPCYSKAFLLVSPEGSKYQAEARNRGQISLRHSVNRLVR